MQAQHGCWSSHLDLVLLKLAMVGSIFYLFIYLFFFIFIFLSGLLDVAL